MSTADQTKASEIQGIALLLAQDERLRPLLEQLAQASGGRDDLRVRTAGEIAGYWMANPASHQGEELIAAGLLLLSGYVDGDRLLEAIRDGYARGLGSLEGYDPSR